MNAPIPNSAPQSSETQLVPGYWLDRYELLAPVAQGGFGAVWLGRLRGKRGFEKLVAIKVPRLNGDVSFQEMLLDEARIASAIDHDNVAKIIELGEQGEILYIVMEWIDGEPVSTLLRALDKTKTQIPIPIALRIIIDMCSAAHAAHELRGPDGQELGVVHRDISPQNMLITSNGVTKLIDFGIAKARDRAAGDTTDGTLKGKVKYMAPEQALGRAVDRRSDVFALGAVLYRFLSGRAPFEAENEIATIHRLATGAPPQPLPDTIPTAVKNVVMRALSLQPSARYKTALEMHAALNDVGLAADGAQIAEFIEIHLKERLAKRRAAIDIALKAAADRTALGDIFPAPLSSRDHSAGPMSESGLPTSDSRSQSQQVTPGAVESSQISQLSQVTGPNLPAPSRLRWLWALAVGVGALGVVMIVVVATRTKPPPDVPAAQLASSPPPEAPPPEAPPEPPPVTPVAVEPSPSAAASASASASAAKPAPRPVFVAPAGKPKPKPAASAKPSNTADFGY
ncbi:MAG: serine/threonine protein kinase [Labilithrix sp.]|nr:serine/threonine protein kinase [Labilithrix sp.]MCW5810653.1 serine/threonine protein kinase [Labilithrix sp.]